MLKNNQKNTISIKGSFLIELLIAFAIISIAMTVIVDAFISSQRSYYITAEQGQLTSALTMLLEDMTREARISSDYTFADPTFTMTYQGELNNQDGDETVVYTYDAVNNKITKTFVAPSASPPINTGSLDITPPHVEITSFSVEIIDNEGHLDDQPRALVTLSARAQDNNDIVVNLQTSFTERVY